MISQGLLRRHPRNAVALKVNHPNSIKLDIGCGSRKRCDFDGFVGIDKAKVPGVDIVRDIERGLPFCDCSIDFVFASHLMEHIKDLTFVMDEVWRVLKREGILEIISPKHDSPMAYYDPTHIRFIHKCLWNWWDLKYNDPRQYGFNAVFHVVKSEEKGEGVFATLMAVK